MIPGRKVIRGLGHRGAHRALGDDSYEPPPADDELIAALREAVREVPALHEAYLVTRRRVFAGQEKVEIGVEAHVGGRWRSRRHLALLGHALHPFFPDQLHWVYMANSPVPEDIRAVGTRLS